MIKEEEVEVLSKHLNEANEREMKSLNMYEEQRLICDEIQAHLNDAQERLASKDAILAYKDSDIHSMKVHVDRAMERERNMQHALEE